MKKILNLVIVTTLFVLLGQQTQAQGNLQFNQVVYFDITSGGTQNIAVPAGKVWKIESTGCGGTNTPHLYLRNSSVQNIGYLGSPASTSNSALPYWLPSGFTGSLYNPAAARSTISIIEFNVNP